MRRNNQFRICPICETIDLRWSPALAKIWKAILKWDSFTYDDIIKLGYSKALARFYTNELVKLGVLKKNKKLKGDKGRWYWFEPIYTHQVLTDVK